MSIGDKVSMFYNAKPIIFERARELRNEMTQAEKTVWRLLSSKRMLGYRFKAQHPIDIFIADFYCHELKLVIEIDGGIHLSKEQKEYDLGRDSELERSEISVMRFTNSEIENDIKRVRKEIESACQSLFSAHKSCRPEVPFRGFRGEKNESIKEY
jgi:very-short-patch-repair endonuclease